MTVTPAAPPKPHARRSWRLGDYLIYLVFVGICLIFALATPNFFTAQNLLTVLKQTSFIAIVAVGMTFVIITAGIDLSVGGVVALAGVLATMALMQWHLPLPLAALVGIATGLAVGAFNGVAITRFNLPPFIATLAMWFIAGRDGGLAFLLTGGQPIWNLPDRFTAMGTGGFRLLSWRDAAGNLINLELPYVVLVMLAVVVAGHVVLSRTAFGRHVLAVGANAEASRLSGINVRRVTFAVYALCGTLTGLSSLLLSARLGSGDPKSGMGMELDAIAAVVVGGTSLMGGKGTILGTLVGALIMGVINNGLVILQVSPYWQPVFKGAVIMLAVLIDQVTKKH